MLKEKRERQNESGKVRNKLQRAGHIEAGKYVEPEATKTMRIGEIKKWV
jgi:hypothetical protein